MLGVQTCNAKSVLQNRSHLLHKLRKMKKSDLELSNKNVDISLNPTLKVICLICQS